ncbi:MAG: hypothetical protein VW397_06500, partial [Candidatus Margulisiibacteriota bacterium]
DLRVTSLRLPSYKIVETDDFEFNFKENQNTMFFFNGDLGLSNNLSGNIIIKEPNYKLINKKPNSSPINDLIAFINNKDIQFNFYIDGSIDNLTINTETNLPQIIKLAKDEVLSTKIKRFNKIKRRQIKKIKSENNNKIDTEIAKFSNQYEQIEYSANFQIIEIENQINVNKSNIQKKQDEIKTSLEESIKSSINNLNI